MANIGQNPTLSKHGNNWTVRLLNKETGKYERVAVCPIKGEGALDKIGRRNKVNQILNSTNPLPRTLTSEQKQGISVTFRQAAESWLRESQTRRRNPIARNTAANYTHNLNRWCYPIIGEMQVSQVRNMAAKQVVDAMLADKNPASPSVINDTITNIQQVVAAIRDLEGEPVYNVKWDRGIMDAPEADSGETKAFTKEQIEEIIQRTDGQYNVLFALLAASGLRIGEALAIEINADPETTTTLSADCCVIYVNSIVLQDGTKQEFPKTNAGVREVDIHPDVAVLLTELIDERKSGYLFCTVSGKAILYSNLYKNVFKLLLWNRKRPVMRREGKGWKKVGVKVIPGVLKADKPNGRTGYGEHSFRRFRATHLDLEGVPQAFQRYWLGHGAKSITEGYQKAKQETTKRREWCEKAGLGFELPTAKVVDIKTAGKNEKDGKAA